MDFSFDFVEVCGGAAGTSACLAAWGYTVMPPIELSDSPHYDLRDLKVVEWLCNMLQSKRLRGIMLEPVCTTFSPAAHPCVRAYAEPKGFCMTEKKTFAGNLIAFRCFLRGSPLFAMFLACWSSLDFRKLPGCQFGGFCGTSRILVRQLLRHVNLAAHIARSSDFFSGRLRPRLWNVGVQVVMLTFPFMGATKASAVYVPELAKHFARAFASALDRDFRADAEGPRISGVESVVANDLLLSGSWREVLQWH